MRFSPSAIRFSGAVLIFIHNALSPLEVVAVRSIVMRASRAGILLDRLRSKSSSAAPALIGQLNPFRSISPMPPGSFIVPGLQASPWCEKTVMPNSLAATLYIAPLIFSSKVPFPARLVLVPRVTSVGDNDVIWPWVEESPQSDQLSLIVPLPDAAAAPTIASLSCLALKAAHSGSGMVAAGRAMRFSPSAIRFSGAVLTWTHKALSPLEALAVSSMVVRASFAGMLLDKVRSKSTSALPGLSGHLNPL